MSELDSVKHCEFLLDLAKLLFEFPFPFKLIKAMKTTIALALPVYGLLSLTLATFKRDSYHNLLVIVITVYINI